MWIKKWEEIRDNKQEPLQCTEKTFKNAVSGSPACCHKHPWAVGGVVTQSPTRTITLQSRDSIFHRAPQQGQTSTLFRLSELLV